MRRIRRHHGDTVKQLISPVKRENRVLRSTSATEDVVWHIDLTWKFPDGSGDTAYTEIQRATTADYANPELLVLVPYPAADYQHGPMPAGVRQWYRARLIDRIGNAGDWTDWVMGTSSIDVSEITNDILEDMKDSDTFKDLIENAVDSNEKIAGMVDDIKQNADDLEQQAWLFSKTLMGWRKPT